MSAGGRVKVTLPLNAEQRASLASWLAEYDKACDAAWAEYEKVRAAAWAEYVKACDAAWAEYTGQGSGLDQAQAEYNKVFNVAWAECDKACAASRAEYVKARDANPLVSWIIANFMDSYESQPRDVLDALAGGADLDALRALAEGREWCEVWDDALVGANELFDIEGLS